MRASAVLCALLGALVVRGEAPGGGVRRAVLRPAEYELETTLLLNAAERRDRDVGFRVRSRLLVTALPAPEPLHAQLRFQLVDSTLLVRGAHRSAEWEARESAWRGAGAAWAALLDPAGRVRALRLPADHLHLRNYKRAVTSLFQVVESVEGVAHNETDSSGACSVQYETLGAASVRKVKRACAHDDSAGVLVRRLQRYSLGAGGKLAELHAEEVVVLRDALKLRSLHTLTWRGEPGAPAAEPEGLQDADLELEGAPADAAPLDDDEDLDLEEAVRLHAEALAAEEPGAGGDRAALRALAGLVPAAARASEPALRAALEASEGARRAGLCTALGLAASPAAARAAADFLLLDAADPPRALARTFLRGLALAHRPHPAALRLLLARAARARDPLVADAAFLAVAAAASRADPDTAAAARDALLRALAECRSAPCRASRLLALGNLRAPVADVLAAAALDAEPDVALAALDALRQAPDVRPEHLRRAGRVATDASAPLEVRAAALDLVVSRRVAGSEPAAPVQLLTLLGALTAERGAAAHELRRLLWARLEAERGAPPVRELLRVLPRRLRGWDARAAAGTSQEVRRALRWGAPDTALRSTQAALGGALRRGRVLLAAAGEEQLEVAVWTRGLHALTGGAGPEHEEVRGGLALAVAGARLPDVTLFDGQAELLSAVWAGAGSTPTPVVRAARVVAAGGGALPLAAGCWARSGARAAAALALDAQAVVSLWQRTARAALDLRAAGEARAALLVQSAGARLHARRELGARPRLRIGLDVDFYSGVAVCARAVSPPHSLRDELRLEALLGARRLNVSRGFSARSAEAGRTLALGRDNDAACRTLRAADDEDEQ